MQSRTLTRPAPALTPRAAVQQPTLRTWTITASLLAARREADGTIRLAIADPTGRPHRMLVTLPGACGPGDAALRRRLERARATFLREVGEPPFEGDVLLYGNARLTLALPAAGTGIRRRPQVLEMTLLDARPPCCTRCASRAA